MAQTDAECPCCGEPYQVSEGDPAACACEWEGCDENCPVVGHLYAGSPSTSGDER